MLSSIKIWLCIAMLFQIVLRGATLSKNDTDKTGKQTKAGKVIERLLNEKQCTCTCGSHDEEDDKQNTSDDMIDKISQAFVTYMFKEKKKGKEKRHHVGLHKDIKTAIGSPFARHYYYGGDNIMESLKDSQPIGYWGDNILKSLKDFKPSRYWGDNTINKDGTRR